jgi:hypothetical protein
MKSEQKFRWPLVSLFLPCVRERVLSFPGNKRDFSHVGGILQKIEEESKRNIASDVHNGEKNRTSKNAYSLFPQVRNSTRAGT